MSETKWGESTEERLSVARQCSSQPKLTRGIHISDGMLSDRSLYVTCQGRTNICELSNRKASDAMTSNVAPSQIVYLGKLSVSWDFFVMADLCIFESVSFHKTAF